VKAILVRRVNACIFCRASVLALLSLLLLSACATLPRTPVPLDEIYAAAVPDMPGIRAWGGQPSPEFQRDLVESVRQERAAEDARPDGGVDKYAALALSGGGSDGAFGAGFLNGWSAARTRPDFKLVTGISTGALTAPFAFLGSDYDAELKQVYTTITTENILISTVFSAFFSRARHLPNRRRCRISLQNMLTWNCCRRSRTDITRATGCILARRTWTRSGCPSGTWA
jgi:hypothetical protein